MDNMIAKSQRNVLLKVIKNICKEVSSTIPYVNSGGCGVFAYELADRLSMFDDGVRIRLYNRAGYVDGPVVVNTIESNIEDRSNWDDWIDNGILFDHVTVEYKNKIIDCMGIRKLDNSKVWNIMCELLDGDISIPTMGVLAYNEDATWNPRFNREDIPRMTQIMDKEFMKLFH